MVNRILEPPKRAVMEKRSLHSGVAKWRRSELVPVGWIPGHLFQTEVFILIRTVRDDFAFAHAEEWRYLLHADIMHLKVAEHLIGSAGHLVALDTLTFSEENQGPLFLRDRHGAPVAPGETIKGSVGEDEGELKFGDCLAELGEIDRGACRHG